MITKEDLRDLADACIQDEPAACTAACPLHVDVRAVLAAAARGEWAAAQAELRKALPFPGIIGRICTAPCVPACKRAEAGAAIRIAAVERACADFGPAPAAPQALPARGRRVAVVGGGLSGLTAAFDLSRRGYTTVVFEAAQHLGGSLRTQPHDVLPAPVVDAELAVVAAAGAQVRLGAAVDAEVFRRLCAEYDAVYLASGATGDRFGLAVAADGGLQIDPVTRMTSREGVFAGGGVCRGGGDPSPVESASAGRRGATSVDRYLQQVSLSAAREGEGSHGTRLFTRTDDVEPLPAVPMSDPAQGYSRSEAMAEAARCIQCTCLECVKACPYLDHYGSYPSMYARRVLHNMMMIKGNHTANRLINSCSLCGLCAEVCPTHVDMGVALKRVRERMVAQGSMPPSAHDFALRDMEFSNSEAFALARALPGRQHCRYAFFPGCQLAGSSPDDVERVYGYLRETLGDVGLILRCCGAPADWAGRTDLLEDSWAAFDAQYQALGAPTLVLACTSCAQVFATGRPDIPLVSLWTVLDEHGLPAGTHPAANPQQLSIHDPCTARHQPQIQDSVRNVLERLGHRVEELPLSRERTECCSYGGLMWLANREVAEQVVQRRIAESPHDYLTYCVMCRDLFAARGKRTVHLLDLVYGDDVDARATRPGPGYTQRHENRARLKRSVLRSVWGEDMEDPSGAALIRLRMSAEVRATLEQRLILVEDVQRAVHFAERTGEKLRDTRTGHWLAHHRPRAVTYWVEYSTDGEEFVVHRAYCHRLQVIEGVPHDR